MSEKIWVAIISAAGINCYASCHGATSDCSAEKEKIF